MGDSNHNASVFLNPDGSLSVNTDGINLSITDIGSTRPLRSVVPNDDDVMVPTKDSLEAFERLSAMNISLTNACNLSCSYCYEQHNTDYGRFTIETIKQAYDFLKDINDLPRKTLIFFGGEPLIHKKLIISFLETYKEELALNADWFTITMVSNGLLMTPDFIKDYFSYPMTEVILSIDTFDATNDQRHIPQESLNALKETMLAIPEEIRTNKRVTIRPTVSHATAIGISEFLEECYSSLGIRSYIAQPLVMGNIEGFVDWTTEQWSALCKDVFDFVRKHPDIHIEVTEGVGTKSYGNNCLNKFDIISIDPSGDFSGCFFFVNKKEDAGSLISGNIFKDYIFQNRQENFDTAYTKLFEHEQCQACDLQDHCYQCPAGNLDTGGSLFRPDSMCQRFVQFYLDMNEELFKIRYSSAASKIISGIQKHGESYIDIQFAEYIKSDEIKLTDDVFDNLIKGHNVSLQNFDKKKITEENKRIFQLTLLAATIYEI